MKPTTAVGVIIGAIGIMAISITIEAWLLGIILSWFGVNLTFWQNFLIIVLANSIFKNSGGSSK